MLRRFSLEGFRSWDARTTIDLAPLTILAGANNAGKSSLLGALLALVQSEQAVSGDILLLSGDWVDLGPFGQLLSPGRTSDFSIGLVGTGAGQDIDVVWDFEEAEDRDQPLARLHRLEALRGEEPIELIRSSGARGFQRSLAGQAPVQVVMPHPGACLMTAGSDTGKLISFLPFSPAQVLSVGPYRAPPERVSPYRRGLGGPSVGRYGEYAAQVFWEHRQRESDILPGSSGKHDNFTRAVDAWWQFILEAQVEIRVEDLRHIGFSVRIDTPGADSLSFAQVGFGLSQLWPILVAALASRPGDLVIVETPEAHLHPAAQHRLTSLFVELARRGRQVIVETHSEHVVAGTCLAVKEGNLRAEQLALHYLTLVDGQTCVERIPVDPAGRRLKAPPGFFDQAARDLLDLLR